MSPDAPGAPPVGVIGGSGFYEFMTDATSVNVDTPFGDPSATVSVGTVGDRGVAFIPRHGRHHELPPHRVNYQANMWALRAVGVRQVLAPCAVGSLRPELGPGSLVVPDQLVDRTSGRRQTYYDVGAVHVPFADPYCPTLRRALCAADPAILDGATMVVVEGPRFSTRAESSWYAGLGWSLVNMTGHPEAVLARELALCYAAVALVTDRDVGAGAGAEESVNQQAVFAQYAENVDRLRELLRRVVVDLPVERSGCSCEVVLDGIALPFELP